MALCCAFGVNIPCSHLLAYLTFRLRLSAASIVSSNLDGPGAKRLSGAYCLDPSHVFCEEMLIVATRTKHEAYRAFFPASTHGPENSLAAVNVHKWARYQHQHHKYYEQR